MAGSRYEKVGTIFSRTSGLLRSGVIKDADKPLWFQLYKAFPPKYEPRADRPVPKDEIKTILYPEDISRANNAAQAEDAGLSFKLKDVAPLVSPNSAKN